MTNKLIIAVKGFCKDWTCRDVQYKIGETRTLPEEEVVLCEKGFHSVSGNPFHVFDYYAPARSVYGEVETDVVDEENDKVVGSRITVRKELSIEGLRRVFFRWFKRMRRPESYSNAFNTVSATSGDETRANAAGDMSIAADTGDYSYAGAGGDMGAACETGDASYAFSSGLAGAAANTGKGGVCVAHNIFSVAAATGDDSLALTTGTWGIASNSGNGGVARSLGYGSACAASAHNGQAVIEGYKGVAATSGDYAESHAKGTASVAVATGSNSEAYASGEGSIALGTGDGAMLQGVKGSVLIWALYSDYNRLHKLYATRVDGERVKADTLYKIVGEELTEVDPDNKYL